MDERKKVIAIVGATGTGKSALADALAAELGGELVSADSIQIYKGMDIGTAKTPVAERSVSYHCMDLVDPDFAYTAALYQREARRVIDGLLDSGKPAVVCGGTGLYVRAALDDFRFDENRELYKERGREGIGGETADVASVEAAPVLSPLEKESHPISTSSLSMAKRRSDDLRQQLNAQAEKLGSEAFYALLAERDPESAALIHPNNVRRVVRAFEFLQAGSSYAKQHTGFESFKAVYPTHFIGISVEHEVLYESIERRVDAMMAAGLLDEVESLIDAGHKDAPAIRQGIGYKELIPVLDGSRSLDEAVAEIKQSTRRYAKRQRTWFKRDPRIVWIDATDEHRMRLAGEMDGGTFTRELLDKAFGVL
ncbi:MAG TPA: tRNA (adenosine(37)-N6)-dimethylallyltransferase MiaA [Coriobacteriia bacterium]|nr:tRNA (adenosine(37)-N6)-dimethylallyltransferase MiaA [Coriobacteriia bacterium]